MPRVEVVHERPGYETRRRLETTHLDPLARGEAGDRAEHREPVIAGGVDRAAAQLPPSPRPRKPSSVASIVGTERRAVPPRPSRSGPTPCAAAPPRPRTTVSPSANAPSSATSGSSSIISGTSPASTDGRVQTRRAERPGRRPARRSAMRAFARARPSRPSAPSRPAGPCASGCTPTSRRTSSEPGDQRRRRPRRTRPRRSRPAPSSSPSVEPLDRPDRDGRPLSAARPYRDARRAQHPLRVVAARQPLDDRGLALREQPREQHARLHLRARDRQLVADALAVRARDASAEAAGRRGTRRRRPSRRSGSATRSTGRRRMLSSPSSVQRPPPCPASQPGSSRSSVPALPTSIALARSCAPAQARRRGSRARPVARTLLDLGAELRDGRERRGRVGGAQVVADPRLAVAHRGQQRRAVRDRLVGRRSELAGDAAWPARTASGSTRAARRRSRPRRPGNRARRSARPHARRSRSPATQSAIAPDRMSGAG